MAAIKKQVRAVAEKEEYKSYTNRMPEEWLKDLRPLQTGWQKEFLETAPYLVIVFKKNYEIKKDGSKGNVYYATESCGLACGFLLAAIHHDGLVALTHIPSPMSFLSKFRSFLSVTLQKNFCSASEKKGTEWHLLLLLSKISTKQISRPHIYLFIFT